MNKKTDGVSPFFSFFLFLNSSLVLVVVLVLVLVVMESIGWSRVRRERKRGLFSHYLGTFTVRVREVALTFLVRHAKGGKAL